jgi:hypothetical protein
MSENIKQRYNATTQTGVSNPFRNVDLSDGSPALDGDVIVFGGVCDTAGAAVDFATQTTLAALNTKVPALGQALAAGSVPVVLTAAQITTLTPPAAITGFALAANQLADGHNVTVSGSVTANIGTVGTLATAAKQDTGNTSLSAIASALAGTLTVGSHAVTNAGTFAVQVDGSALTSLQLLDDSVATVGSAIVSKGMAAVGTDGTNARILKTDAAGELQVDVLTMPSVAVTNAGTFVVQENGAALTALQLLDNVVQTGTLTKPMLTVGGWSPDFAAYHELQITSNGYLGVDVLNNVNVTTTDGYFSVRQDVAHCTTHGSIWSSGFTGQAWHGYGSATAPTDVDAGDAARPWFLLNGSQVCNLAVGGTLVTGSAGLPVAQQGTWTVGLSAAQTLATVTSVTTLANGQTAHDSAATGSPLRIGAKAETSLAGITLVADGDATDLYAGVDGVQITRPYCNLEDIVSGVAAITDGSSTSVIASQGAGIKTYITSVAIANSSATAVTVDIRDGAAGTVKLTLPVPADVAGVVFSLPVPLPFSAATAVCADPSAAASTVTVTLIGFKSKV